MPMAHLVEQHCLAAGVEMHAQGSTKTRKFIPHIEVCQQLKIQSMPAAGLNAGCCNTRLHVTATQWSDCKCLQQMALGQMLQIPSNGYEGYRPPETQLTCRAESVSRCHRLDFRCLPMLLLPSIPWKHDGVRQFDMIERS